MDNKTNVVRCRNVFGAQREITMEDVNEFVSPGAALEQRLVRVNEEIYVCKFVSRAAGSHDKRLYDLLENEIRAGTRLGQVFSAKYPAELASLAAYNFDAEEPFLLLRQYVGIPAAGAVSRLSDAERRQFETGLLHALHLTGLAGVVHGAVTMDAVRWHHGKLQLVDFEAAKRAGEPARDRVVDVRDDLLSAGMLIRRLHVGPSRNGSWPDRSHDPERLRALLDPVFDNAADQRPHAADLLRRLRAEAHQPVYTDPDAQFATGRAQFEQVSRSKRSVSTPAVTPAPSKPGNSIKRLVFVLVAVVVVAVVIAGTVVLK